MIRLAHELSTDTAERFGVSSVTAKITGLFTAYGAEGRLADFYTQDREGVLTAVMCRFEGQMLLSASYEAELEELREFLPVVCNRVTATDTFIKALGYRVSGTAICLERQSTAAYTEPEPFSHPSTDAVFNMLSEGEDGDIALPDRESFCVDVSHRMRHGAATAVLNKSGVAVCGFMSRNAALISGVAVRPDMRGRGEGVRLVEELMSRLGGRKCFALCSPERRGFYEKCGFSFSSVEATATIE